MRLLPALGLSLLIACGGGSPPVQQQPPPVETVPLTSTITAAGLSAPVDLVRDEHGVPHIYGQTYADVAYAQGYITALDRFPQMDITRRFGEGTIGALAGALRPETVDNDIRMRIHHFRANAEAQLAQLRASANAD